MIINAEVLSSKTAIDEEQKQQLEVKVLGVTPLCGCNPPKVGSLKTLFMAKSLGTVRPGDKADFEINCAGDVRRFGETLSEKGASACGCDSKTSVQIFPMASL